MLTENIKFRFPNREMLSCFSIFDPMAIPEKEMVSYGNRELKILYQHYKSVINCPFSKIESEWNTFKYVLKESNTTATIDKVTCKFRNNHFI